MDFIVDPGLVLYLPLYELDGASFASRDAYRHPCRVTGALWTPRGRNFDGSDDLIDCRNPASLVFGNGASDSPFSVLAWVKMDDATNFAILTKGTAGKYEYGFHPVSSDKLHIECYSGGGAAYIGREYSAAMTPYEGVWIFMAGSYDGKGASSGCRLYLNTERVDDTSIGAGTYVAMNNYGETAKVGRKWASTTARGLISEVWVFNRPLSVIELQRIYLATKWRYR